MEEKSHGEKTEVVQENGKSTGRDSGQVKENEMNLSWLETENPTIENYNDWLRTIKRCFDV